MSRDKQLRLELLVASPPTKKCKELISNFEIFTAEFPQIRLDVYYAGTPPKVNTTEGFKKNIDKRVKIPIAFVNGCQLDKEKILSKEDIREIIKKELGKEPTEWYD